MSALQPEEFVNFPRWYSELAKLEASAEGLGNSFEKQLTRIRQQAQSAFTAMHQLTEKIAKISPIHPDASQKVAEYGQQVQRLGLLYQTAQKNIVSLNEAQQAQRESVKLYQDRLQELDRQFKALDSTQKGYLAKKRQIAAETKQVTAVIKAHDTALKQAKQAIDAAEGSYDRLSRQVVDMKTKLRAMPDAWNQSTGAINQHNRAAVDLQRQIEKSDAALKKMDASMGNHQRNVGNYASALSGLKGHLLNFGASYISIEAGLSGLKQAFGIMTEMERMDAALRAVTRDNEDFNQTQQFLISLSKDLGQNYLLLTKTYKGLAAATRETSLEGKVTQQIFKGVIEAGATLQLSNEEVEGSLYAISQMVSKGKVSMEELRQQLGERMPGAMRLLATALGVSEMKLNKLVEDGKLYARDVLPKLATELDRVYGPSAQKNIDKFGAQWNILNTEVALFLKMLNEEEGATGPVAGFINILSNRLEKVRLVLQSKDWGLILKLATDLTGYNQEVNEYVQRRKANYGDEQAYKALTPEARAARRSEFIDRQSALQARLDQAKQVRPTSQIEDIKQKSLIKTLENQIALYDRKLLRMQEINAAALKQEAITGEQLKKEAAAQKAMEWEEGKKKRDAAQAKAERQASADAVDKLRTRLDTSRDNTQTQVKGLQARHEDGSLSDADFAKEKYDEIIKGAMERHKILLKAAQSDFKEVKKAAEDGLREENKVISDAGADFLKARTDAAKQSLKVMVDNVREGIKDIDSEVRESMERALTGRNGEYEAEELRIRQAMAKRQLTEEDGYRQLFENQVAYYKDVAAIQSHFYGQDIKLTDQLIDAKIQAVKKWAEVAGRTEAEKAEAANVIRDLEAQQAANKRKEELANVKQQGDSVTAINQATSDKNVKITEEEYQKRRQIIEGVGETMTTVAGALFEIDRAYRNQALAELEDKKERELAIAGENKEAQQRINEVFEKKERAIRRKQALADRNQALFDVAINTAVNASKYTPLNPLFYLALANGVAQAAVIISKPLPAYKEGKKASDSYSGLALAGEAGPELWLRGDSATLVDKPTVIDTKAGDTILKASDTDQLLRSWKQQEVRQQAEQQMLLDRATLKGLHESRFPQPPIVVSTGLTEKGVEKAMTAALAKQSVHQTIIDEDGFHNFIQQGQNRTEYFNKRYHLPRRS
ncbi:hypothetical protein GCM10027299_03310 [Larkinella ripae]